MAAAGVPTAGTRSSTRSTEGLAAIAVLSGGDQGRRSCGGQGRGDRRRRDRGTGRARRDARGAPLRPSPGGGRGAPRRRGAVAARAVRRRARGAARACAGLQADRRRRHRPQHRWDGATPRYGGRTRRSRSSSDGPSARARRAARPRPALPRRPLRRAHADRRGCACSSSTRASAIPRPKPCSRASKRPARPALARPCPAGSKGPSSIGTPRAVTVVLASAGYPESSSSGDVISGLDACRRTSRCSMRARRSRAAGSSRPADACSTSRRSATTPCRPGRRVCCRRHDRVRVANSAAISR